MRIRQQAFTTIRIAVVCLVVGAVTLASFLRPLPADAIQGVWAPPNITDITTGERHSCGIADGKAYCWGSNIDGQLGNGSVTPSATPTPVDTSGVLAGKTVTDIATSYFHTCAVASGKAYCWGLNDNGNLGDGTTNTAYSPVAVNDTGVLSGKTVTAINVGIYHTCAVADQRAYCWGSGTNGKLGRGSTTASSVPVAVSTSGVLSGVNITHIAVGGQHTCVIGGGRAYCWGLGTDGRLGHASTGSSSSPVAVATNTGLSGKTLTDIAASEGAHTCSVASGLIYCWGANGSGQLGTGNTTATSSPIAALTSGVLGSKTATKVTTGYSHTCAIASGIGACWGYNGGTATTYGRLGVGTTTSYYYSPTAMNTSGHLNGKTLTEVSAFDQHSCVIASGKIHCFGTSTDNRLGNNDTSAPVLSATPVVAIDGLVTSSYRVYVESDTAVPGLPLGNASSPTQMKLHQQKFRLRMGIQTATLMQKAVEIPTNGVTIDLQYAAKTAASCAAQTTGYAALTTSTPIGINTTAGATSGATAVAHSPYDPTNIPISYMTYNESSASIGNASPIQSGSMGLWDFALKVNDTTTNAAYCLRLTANSAPLDQYTSVAEVITAPPSEVDMSIVDSSGVAIPSHSAALSTALMLTQCQTATGYLTSSTTARIRTFQTGPPVGWTVSIAPTDGPLAKWTRSDNSAFYDFNDPSGSPAGCNSGSDGDGLAGQLTILQDEVLLSYLATTSDGQDCLTGAFRGPNTSAFSSTTTAVTLISVSASAPTNCRRDYYNVKMSQTIPAGQREGQYTLDLTMTTVYQ